MVDLNNNGKDDLQEIEDGLAQFFNDAKNLNGAAIIQDLKNGAAWVINEIEALSEEAQQFLTGAFNKVRAESAGLGEQVANLLTLIYNQAAHLAANLSAQAIAEIQKLSSAAITAFVGVMNGQPAAA